MDFEDIRSAGDLQRVSEEAVWQNFERLAAFIFEQNGFSALRGRIVTLNRRRRQYDVIARKNDKTFLVECKRWSGSRYRLSALLRAVEQHRERCEFYRAATGERARPVIVTLIEEEVQFHDGIPIVPIHKLNSFLQEE
ncbi:MAG TPA: restriction endonuclease [Methanothrix sp.]|nr:restriction endonuclease [Methanothrix sp.]